MTTPPDQPEDAALREKVQIQVDAYTMLKGGDPSSKTLGAYGAIDNIMQLFHAHEQEKVQAAEASGAEKLAALLKVGAELTDSVNIDQALRIFKATQPPAVIRDATKNSAADTTKQGEGESDE